jgi:hypothetical protein
MNQSNVFSLNESNEYSRATIIAGRTFKRFQKEGISDAEAKRLVAAVINQEEAEMKKQNRPFDEAVFLQRMHQLP